ncbi:MAG: DNA polymerase IV [Armatimonadetes bacterium]|nr:MAG: DNA polymerase IV [Armatimonadota bacterium]
MDVPSASAASILHADLDAFYAAVAVKENPSLAGKPMAVGAGVVLSCTYEARVYGVRGGMPVREARSMCPQLIVVDGTFGAYTEYSKAVFTIYESYTPVVERLSIDEAFMDVSGSIHLFGTPADIGRSIRDDVKRETGLAVSVGATPRKFLSKIASQVAKPDGLIVVNPGEELEFLHPLPVSYLWGVGPVTKRRLNNLGIHTIGDIAATPRDSMASMLGSAHAAHLYALSHNLDPRPVETRRKAKSLSAQSAMRARIRTLDELLPVLNRLTDRVAGRMRAKDLSARTVTIKIRFGDLSSITRSTTMPTSTGSTGAIVVVATKMLERVLAEFPKHETTLLSVAASGIAKGEPTQLAFGVDDDVSGGSPRELEYEALDQSVDALRKRFGADVITHGSDLLSGRTKNTDGLSEIMTND